MESETGTTEHCLELLKELESNPSRFGFFQAMRALQAAQLLKADSEGQGKGAGVLAPRRKVLGASTSPQEDLCVFFQLPELDYIGSPIRSFHFFERPLVMMRGFGLLGLNGPMPPWMTQWMASQQSIRSGSIQDQLPGENEDDFYNNQSAAVLFINILQSRFYSLLYRAWEVSQKVVVFDRPEALRTEPGLSLPQALRCLTGLLPSTDVLSDLHRLGRAGTGDIPFPKHVLDALHSPSFYSSPLRHPEGLRKITEQYFNAKGCRVPVATREFAMEWVAIPAEATWRLGSVSESGEVAGLPLLLGTKAKCFQSHFAVRIGPMCRDQYEACLPGGVWHEELCDLIALYSGGELTFELELILERKVSSVLGECDGLLGRLGYTTWLLSESPGDLGPADISDLRTFAAKIDRPALDPATQSVSQFIRRKLKTEEVQLLDHYLRTLADGDALKDRLAALFGSLGTEFADISLFGSIKLSEASAALLQATPAKRRNRCPDSLLTRMLLEDAYPSEIRRPWGEVTIRPETFINEA